MRRRLTLLVACTATCLGAFGIGEAQATTVSEPGTPAVSSTSSEYWACAALKVAPVGACVENPLPDPSILPSPRQTIYDLTGVNV